MSTLFDELWLEIITILDKDGADLRPLASTLTAIRNLMLNVLFHTIILKPSQPVGGPTPAQRLDLLTRFLLNGASPAFSTSVKEINIQGATGAAVQVDEAQLVGIVNAAQYLTHLKLENLSIVNFRQLPAIANDSYRRPLNITLSGIVPFQDARNICPYFPLLLAHSLNTVQLDWIDIRTESRMLPRPVIASELQITWFLDWEEDEVDVIPLFMCLKVLHCIDFRRIGARWMDANIDRCATTLTTVVIEYIEDEGYTWRCPDLRRCLRLKHLPPTLEYLHLGVTFAAANAADRIPLIFSFVSTLSRLQWHALGPVVAQSASPELVIDFETEGMNEAHAREVETVLGSLRTTIQAQVDPGNIAAVSFVCQLSLQ
ncbi:hypothetical protein BDW22DRAFT_1348261 [Trametopsis cervina]|nr:hypothetical protein BDW22DRAFT_1348261 [Trametopsis cervina]